jgi:Spy/CpxP family protein refolding chaperone
MNRKWIALLVFAAAGLAFGAGRLTAPSRAMMGPADLDRFLNINPLIQRLGLDPKQAADVRSAGRDYAARVKTACDRHCQARCRLAAAIGRDETEARQIVEQMTAASAANDSATLDHILRVRRALTPEQRARFDQWMSDCLCNQCEMP